MVLDPKGVSTFLFFLILLFKRTCLTHVDSSFHLQWKHARDEVKISIIFHATFDGWKDSLTILVDFCDARAPRSARVSLEVWIFSFWKKKVLVVNIIKNIKKTEDLLFFICTSGFLQVLQEIWFLKIWNVFSLTRAIIFALNLSRQQILQFLASPGKPNSLRIFSNLDI